MNLVEKYPLYNRIPRSSIQTLGIILSALLTLVVLSSCGTRDPVGGTTAPTTPVVNYGGAQLPYYPQPGYPQPGYPQPVYPQPGNTYPGNATYYCQSRGGVIVSTNGVNTICRIEYQMPNMYSFSFSFNSYNLIPQVSTGIPVMPGDRLYFRASGSGCGSYSGQSSWTASVGGQTYTLGNPSTLQFTNSGTLFIGMNGGNSGGCFSGISIQELRVVHCEDQTGASVICQ